jgi:hypothetical protein
MIFSNGPRLYALRILETLGVRHCFKDGDIFAVEDVMPHCKPEQAAFDKVRARRASVTPEKHPPASTRGRRKVAFSFFGARVPARDRNKKKH